MGTVVVSSGVVLCCIASVVYGRILNSQDILTNDIVDDAREAKGNMSKVSKMQTDFGQMEDDVGFERGHKDMLYPVLVGVVTKILATIPVFLTTLALMAGYSLATSKAALLVGGGLLFYHLLSQGHLVTTVAKQWKHLSPDWGSALLGHHHYGYHHLGGGYPGLGYHRDRSDHRPDLQLTE